MNDVVTAFAPYVDAVGWTLLHFLWQGVLIGVVYASLRTLHTSSAVRYRIGMICLFVSLACPMLTLAWLWPAMDGTDIGLQPPAAGLQPLQAAESGLNQSGSLQGLNAFLPWFVALWLLGVCLIALRSFLHWRRLSMIVRSAAPLPRAWQMRLLELSQRFGILRPVKLLHSIEVAVPTLVGWLKPTILLPASLLSGFTPAQIELILAHELAHVRRYDYIANLVQVIVETLLFYHPAVHWICADVRQQREQCCDDLALTVGGGERLAYARTLADLEEWLQNGPDRERGATAPALGADGGLLLARVQRIVDPHEALRPSRDNGFTLPMLVAGAGMLLALLRLNSPAADAVHDALVRASATTAELLATATFRIRADTLALPLKLQLQPASIVQQPKPAAGRETTTTAPQPRARESVEVDVPDAAVLSVPSNLQAPIVAAPTIEIQPASTVPEAATVDKAPAPSAVAPQSVKPVHVVSPDYPVAALRNGIVGKVDLDFRVDADGGVEDIRVLSARPAGVFEQAAIAALRQWRFTVPVGSSAARQTRSFAFTRGSSEAGACREVTGSHICRERDTENKTN